MSARLKQILSWWFILQIVLPFTAPLQTLDVHDLFGTRAHHQRQHSPESTTTPTMSESSFDGAVAAVHTAAPAPAHAPVIARVLPARGPIAVANTLSSSPHVQQSVLRL